MQERSKKTTSSVLAVRLAAVLISMGLVGVSVVGALTHVIEYWWGAASLAALLVIVDVGCAIRAKKLTLLDAAGVVCALAALVMSIMLATTGGGN